VKNFHSLVWQSYRAGYSAKAAQRAPPVEFAAEFFGYPRQSQQCLNDGAQQRL